VKLLRNPVIDKRTTHTNNSPALLASRERAKREAARKRAAAERAALAAARKLCGRSKAEYRFAELLELTGLTRNTCYDAITRLRKQGLWPWRAIRDGQREQQQGVVPTDQRDDPEVLATLDRIEAERDARHASWRADRRDVVSRVAMVPIGQRKPVQPNRQAIEDAARLVAVRRYRREWRQGHNCLVKRETLG